MGVQNQDGALYWATGIDNSELLTDAAKAKQIINNLSNEVQKDGSKMESSMNGVGTALAAIGGTAALTMLGKEILDTTAKFEKFGIVLRNTLGKDAGNDALAMIAQFAATTPFQLDEVTGAFIKMANQGFVPTREELVKLGDLASSTGKSFDQLTEALLDAQTGQFERLKEFGIKASAQGDKVTFSFKEQQTTVDNTNSAIQAYMLSLGELKGVTGANALISESLTGQISNLEDKLAMMYNSIGTANSGVLYDAVGLASALVTNYEEVGMVVLSLVSIYGAYQAAMLIQNVIKAAQLGLSATEIALNIGKVNSLMGMTAAQEVETVATIQAATAQTALNVSILANPYALAAAAVVALAAGIYYLATRTTDAEKAHEKLAKTAKESEASIRSEVIQVDTLFARLKAAKTGTDEYKSAKDAIMSQYGQYLKGLGDEKTALNNVALAQRTITNEVMKTARARAMSTATADASTDLANTQGDISDKVKKLIDQKFGVDSKKSLELFAQIKGVIQNGGTVKDSFLKLFDETKYIQNGQFGGITQYVDNELKSLLGKSKQAKQVFDEINKEAEVKFGSATYKTPVKEKAEVSETPAQLKARLAAEKKAKAAADKAKAAQDKIDQKENEGEYNAKKDLQDLLVDLQTKTSNLLLTQQEDSLAKRLSQIEAEKQAEIQKITDKEVSIVEAYNKAHKSDKGFKALSTKPGDVSASVNTIDPTLGKSIQDATTGVVNAYGQKSVEATTKWGEEMTELAMKYAEERVQIEYDYNKEIQILAQNGFIVQAAALTAERDAKISEVTKGLIQETDLYKTATNDKLQASKETTEKLIADIKARIQAEVAAGKLSSETAKKMLEDINTAQTTVKDNNNKNNPFAQLGDAIGNNTTAGKALKAGQLDPKTTTAELAGLESAAAGATASMAGTAGAALQGVKQILGSVTNGLSELGLLTDEEKKTADQVVGMVGGAADLAMGIATGNPMQIIQGSIDMIVNGYKLFDTRTKNADKAIATSKKEVEKLKEAYTDLNDAIDKAFSTTKAKLIEQQMADLKNQNAEYEKMIAAEKSKKNPDTDTIKQWEDAEKENNKTINDAKDKRIEAIAGTSVMSAIDSFAQAYVDAWASGDDAAKKSTDLVKSLLKNSLVNYLKDQIQPEVNTFMKHLADYMVDGVLTAEEKAQLDADQAAIDAKAAANKKLLDPYLSDSTKSGVTGELQSQMTEGTGSQLVGLWSMTSMDIRWIKEWLAMTSGASPVAGNTDVSKVLAETLNETHQINLNTKRSADNSDIIVESLEEIKRNTGSTSNRGSRA